MKSYFLLAFALILIPSLWAQTPEKHSRVEISLSGKDISTLTRLGIETDHGLHAPGQMLVADLSASELKLVQNAGFQTKIWIDDLKKDYLERLQNPSVENRNNNCSSSRVTPYPTPSNYTFGTMGGYHTLAEMMAVLDDMRAKFPNLITAKADASDTIETWEGRKIQFVKISDNPDVDESEPEVLYTGLHHAREPNGTSQMLFYMWYLLENYASDPEVKYIVDHAELYFVPCINPDGYVYNENNDPLGGGLWRKNRRDNGDGSFGVDLNRNYGYFWGNDDSGSSPNPETQTYRGPEAFSEPETRTMRDFARAHNFLLALNYHTYSNLLIYPWAYNNQLAEPALATIGKLLTRENNYKTGTSIETVGYNVNGNSDDWMFAEGGTKSFTPEVGSTGFWPQPNEIDDLNRENMWQNLCLARCALRFGEVTDINSNYISTLSSELKLELIRLGFEDGPLTVTLSGISDNILSVNPGTQTENLDQFETKELTAQINLKSDIQVGDPITLLLSLSNGTVTKSDTLFKFYGGKTEESFYEDGNDLMEWNGDWAQTDSTFVSAPYSITDSPLGNYAPNTYSDLQLSNPGVSIPPGAKNPQIRFWAKWDIESGYDFVQLRARGVTEQALCGRYTRFGSNGAQPTNEPVFEGLQLEWVEECMDLSDFIGQTIELLFIFGSDNFVERDGFYFDDLRVEYIDPTLLHTVSVPLRDFRLVQNEPNPASNFSIVRWENLKQSKEGEAKLLVFNGLGVQITEKTVNLSAQNAVKLDTQNWPAGLYTYILQSTDGQSEPMKMTVVH